MENIDIDIDIDIDMVILENINVDIDKAILQNIDVDKISNRFKFGISNRATPQPHSTNLFPLLTRKPNSVAALDKKSFRKD